PRRVYIAGLSAGGAAAAIMGDTYPDLYAAIGVHSGLACGAARDMPSAFAAMQGNGGPAPRRAPPGRAGSKPRVVPAIVFHGGKDTTVNPRNADLVVAQSSEGALLRKRVEKGQVAGGLAYSRMLHINASGETVVEQWVIHGAGHACRVAARPVPTPFRGVPMPPAKWSGSSSSTSFRQACTTNDSEDCPGCRRFAAAPS